MSAATASQRPVAIVTGGGTGMGRAAAAELAITHSVVIVGRRLGVIEQAATELGESVVAMAADVSNVDDVEAMVARVLDAYGRIDVLLNNAAVRSPRILTTMPLRDSLEIWNAQLANNATSQFLMCYAVAPHLTRPGGRIINVSSHGILTGGLAPGNPAYIAAKGAVQGMTLALARELSGDGITVNVIVPGFIADTELTGQLTTEQQAAYVEEIPVKRPGFPDDVAALVGYLVSPRAGYVTGQFLHLNGGAIFGR
jgi:3-oxoacyl-[acyl-carrier protein] reductase